MFESSAHVGEDAELYALGQLDEARLERFEKHLRACGECARRTGEAEAAVLRLIEAESEGTAPLRPLRLNAPRMPWTWVAAVAAAFVIGLLPWIATLHASGPQSNDRQVAMTAMLHSHFLHASFVRDVSNAPDAKVIYGRTGGWLYVLAAPGNAPLSVVTVSRGQAAPVATLAASSQTRAAFVSLSVRPERVLLVAGGRQLAHANVAFATPAPR